MNREQLSHVLRAAVRMSGDSRIVVIGSQAILGSYAHDELPIEATRSIEADIAFRDDPDERKSDQVDVGIGELSRFHEEFGYYGQGVSVTTAVLPDGWERRTIALSHPDHPDVVCLDAHDLVVAKLVAGREKDFEFTTALIARALVDVGTLRSRADALDAPGAVKRRVLDSIERCVADSA